MPVESHASDMMSKLTLLPSFRGKMALYNQLGLGQAFCTTTVLKGYRTDISEYCPEFGYGRMRACERP